MDNKPEIVADNIVVSLEYILRLKDGEEIDRSDATSPFEYLHGYRNIIPGLEKALEGMSLGDEKEVIISPEEAYGERDEEKVLEFPRDAFPPTYQLEVGETVMMQNNQTGESFEAQIVDIKSNAVTLDFNHPLAGETLHFQVKIAGLRSPTPEELSHGHVHNQSHAH